MGRSRAFVARLKVSRLVLPCITLHVVCCCRDPLSLLIGFHTFKHQKGNVELK